MSAAQNNRSASASSSANEGFTVSITNGGGQTINITYTSDMSVYDLTNKLHKTYLENEHDDDEYILMMRSPPNGNVVNLESLILKPTDILRDKGIIGDTELNVIYKKITSCIRPGPFVEYLHKWIDGTQDAPPKITFVPPFESIATITARTPPSPIPNLSKIHVANGVFESTYGVSCLADYNHWIWDQEYLFVLTNTQRNLYNGIRQFPSIVMGQGSNISYSSINDNGSMVLPYWPNGINYVHGEVRNPEYIIVGNGSSVRGNLNGIKILITQTEISPTMFKRECRIFVELKGYIKIINKNNGYNISLDNKNAICHVAYDYILMCDNQGNLAGGKRRTRRLKRSKRTKRSKNKKTRGHPRKQ